MVAVSGALATRLIVVAAALALVAGAGSAQVALRQTGQALDSNFQIGSGGYNGVAGGIGGVNSQLYVNGQVSGLGNFHGPVGYYAPNQLNLTLPGAGVADFRQRSVGVQEILGGNAYVPAPYYDRLTTVWGLPGVVSSAAAPGTSGLLPPMSPGPLPAPSGAQSTFPYRPLSAGPLVGSGLLPGSEGRAGIIPGLTPKPGESGPSDEPSSLLPPASPSPPGRQQLLRALPESSNRVSQEVDREVKAEVRTDVESVRLMPSLERTTPAAEGGSEQPDKTPAGETPTPPDSEHPRDAALPQRNQDIYTDILASLRQHGAWQKQPSAADRPEASPDQPQTAIPQMPRQGQALMIVPPPQLAEQPAKTGAPWLSRGVVEYTPQTGMILHGLAGRNSDQFNRRMVAAEKDLREGRYAQAASNYAVAIVVDPENPLARIGQGLCSFANGDYVSSSIHIRRAINLFPPIARTRLDLAAMLDVGVMEQRMAGLDSRLSASRLSVLNPGMIFTAAYMHYNLGQVEQARQYAQKLLSTPRVEQAFADFASFVMSDQAAAQTAASGAPGPSSRPAPAAQPAAP
jgi:tetratricopeptide (TPR) repeat protein